MEACFARDVVFDQVMFEGAKVPSEPRGFGADKDPVRMKIAIHGGRALGHDEIAGSQMGDARDLAMVVDLPIETAVGDRELEIVGVQIPAHGTRDDRPGDPVRVATVTGRNGIRAAEHQRLEHGVDGRSAPVTERPPCQQGRRYEADAQGDGYSPGWPELCEGPRVHASIGRMTHDCPQ